LNRELANQIVSFLQISDTCYPQGISLASLDRQAWEDTLRWLDLSGLTLVFWNRLKTSQAHGHVLPEVREQLDHNLASNRMRLAAMQQEFDLINRCLDTAGIQYAALKGFALIPEYCPDPTMRSGYDYDYLVRPSALPSVQEALRKAGFALKKKYEHRVVYSKPDLLAHMPAKRDELYSANFGRTIELHVQLWDFDALRIRLNVSEDALSRRIPHHWESSLFYALADEDHLLFQVLHTFRHILSNWCRLSWLLEIAHFLECRHANSLFWDKFRDHIQGDQRLSEIAGVVFALSTGLFGGSVPLLADVLDSKRSASLDLWVNQYGIDSALDNFSVNKFNLFLHREFVQDHATWREVRRLRLFPIHRPNRAVEASSTDVIARFIAAWKQGLHVAARLLHHLTTTIEYAWEAPRWERLRAGARTAIGD
jgi:hypothetical protein